jgi:hypothetical protein
MFYGFEGGDTRYQYLLVLYQLASTAEKGKKGEKNNCVYGDCVDLCVDPKFL